MPGMPYRTQYSGHFLDQTCLEGRLSNEPHVTLANPQRPSFLSYLLHIVDRKNLGLEIGTFLSQTDEQRPLLDLVFSFSGRAEMP